MLAAEATFDALAANRQRDALTAYPAAFRDSGCTPNCTNTATSSR